MKNDICLMCEGKGYAWQRGAILDRSKAVIAETFRAGEICEACKGTGSYKRATRPVGCGSYMFLTLMLFVFFAFVANPLAHLVSS